MKILITLFVAMLSLAALASTPAGQKNEDGSFKLTDKSVKAMGVEFTTINSSGPWTLPKASLVRIKFTQGVYRRYEGDISFVIVKVIKQDNDSITVESLDIEPGDEIAIKGVTFLRLTEADLNSGTVDACAH
jgi:hypothetical protein